MSTDASFDVDHSWLLYYELNEESFVVSNEVKDEQSTTQFTGDPEVPTSTLALEVTLNSRI